MEEAEEMKACVGRYWDFHFVKALTSLDFSLDRKTRLITRRAVHPKEFLTLHSNRRESIFTPNILLKIIDLCLSRHYGKLRDLFSLENIQILCTIFKCAFGMQFFHKNKEKGFFFFFSGVYWHCIPWWNSSQRKWWNSASTKQSFWVA